MQSRRQALKKTALVAGLLASTGMFPQFAFAYSKDAFEAKSVADVLKGALQSVANQIDVALVFGSVASGKATTGSDIDLLIVGSLNFTDAVSALYPAQDILGREINPKLYTSSEWKAAVKKNSAFIREILQQPVIQVIGDISDPG